VVKNIRFALSYVIDKQETWNDLIKLTKDENNYVRWIVSETLGYAFLYTPDKVNAWNDILKLSFNGDGRVKSGLVGSISTLFEFAPDKHEAWNVLHRLSFDDDIDVRWYSAPSIGIIFSRLSGEEKQQAWKDIHRLVYDKSGLVRSGAAESYRYIFPHIFEKYQQQASDDIHILTLDDDGLVRTYMAETIGIIYPILPGKKRALKDLKRLASDENPYVSSCVYHTFGKISIYNSSQATNEFDCKKELEIAIEYFEESAKRDSSLNSSQFCLPFYRSFHAIIFTKNETEELVNKYLTEAKRAIRESNNKKTLYGAVENLASALTEVQNLDFSDKKEKLNSCRKYCDAAAELMKDTEKTAPYATELIRKGLPILHKKIKNLLKEIQEKAKATCQISQGTPTQEIACAVNIEVQKWEISNQVEMTQKIEDVAYLLKTKVANLPDNTYVLNKIEAMRNEKDLMRQYETLLFVIGQIPTVKVVSERELDQKLNPIHCKLDSISYDTNQSFNEIINIKDKLSYIRFDILKMKWNSAEVVSNLKTMKEELEKLNKIEDLNTVSIENLNSNQKEILNELNNNILERFNEIGSLANQLPNKEDTKRILDAINKLKQSKPEILFQKSLDIISLIGFAIEVFPYLHL